MTDDAALRDAICARKDDDAPRLVYADFLEETGEPDKVARAEFIRVQIALDSLTPADDRYQALRRRQLELQHYHVAKWVHPLGMAMYGVHYRRGFVESATVDINSFLDSLDWFDGEPIDVLGMPVKPGDINALLRAAEKQGEAELAEDLQRHLDRQYGWPRWPGSGQSGQQVRLGRLLFVFALAGGKLLRASESKCLNRLRTLRLIVPEFPVLQFEK